jgi:hypothetical protein
MVLTRSRHCPHGHCAWPAFTWAAFSRATRAEQTRASLWRGYWRHPSASYGNRPLPRPRSSAPLPRSRVTAPVHRPAGEGRQCGSPVRTETFPFALTCSPTDKQIVESLSVGGVWNAPAKRLLQHYRHTADLNSFLADVCSQGKSRHRPGPHGGQKMTRRRPLSAETIDATCSLDNPIKTIIS